MLCLLFLFKYSCMYLSIYTCRYNFSTGFGDSLVSYVIIFAQANNWYLFVEFNEKMPFFFLLYLEKIGNMWWYFYFQAQSFFSLMGSQFSELMKGSCYYQSSFVFDFFIIRPLCINFLPLLAHGNWQDKRIVDFICVSKNYDSWLCITKLHLLVGQLDFLCPSFMSTLFMWWW